MMTNNITLLLSVCVLCVLLPYVHASDGLRLIQFNETYTQLVNEEQLEALMVSKVHFMDITDYKNGFQMGVVPTPDPLPDQPQFKLYVQELIPQLSVDQLTSNLNFLTTFNTRYYRSDTGVAAAKWIAEQFTTIATSRPDITVQLFPHSWAQPSVIATIPGIGPNKDQYVIIGAHEDSIGSTSTGRSPGADDDGTGTVTVLEVFRVLVAANHFPDRTLLFMTYAAEEAGLLGSQDIASSFKGKDENVYAVLQLDMTGYGGTGNIGAIGDYVDLNLTNFVKVLIDTYSVLDWVDTKCGYGCSDHASWTKAGYRSAFPFETAFNQLNPYIHTANDLVNKLSFDRILEFSKVGLAFAIELGGTTIRD